MMWSTRITDSSTWHGPQDGGFDGDAGKYFAGQANGLVGAADPGGVYLNWHARLAAPRMRITLVPSAPPLPPVEYDDVVEVSVQVPAAFEPRWMTWAGETGGPLSGLAPGNYRVRVSAKGRDAGADGEFADGVVDEYVVEIWASRQAPDEILRAGSANAQYWHREWGGRRKGDR